ncbi:MAG: O-antigen ligase family protein [Bacteroidales bacterium]|jgi:O-antigen ligase|nr:O-antigen ligase family protein [Bacteroidales bacterium]
MIGANLIKQSIKPILQWWKGLSDNCKTYISIAVICVAFIGGGIGFILDEYYFYAFIPLAFLCLIFLKYNFTKGLLLIALLTPFSIDLVLNKNGFTLSMPSEPIMIVMMLAFIWMVLFTGKYSLSYVKHPISICIYVYIGWALISSPFSTEPLISFKFIVSRLWFILPMFFIALPFFQNLKNIRTFVICYSISLLMVILYSTINFINMEFNYNAAHFVMQPFYNDHTAYGAIISLFIPISLFYAFSKSATKNKWSKIFFIFMSAVLITALILSYSRAAWLSMVFALGVWIIIKMKIKLRNLLLVISVGGLLIFTGWDVILQRLNQNSQDSSGKIIEHITSMSNISTDDSNVERINRWSCALRMFNQKPVFGFGAGTYQFKYAAYQKSWQITSISTDFGTLGNAHSEYLGSLAEMGVIGLVSIICIFGTTIFIGIRTYRRSTNKVISGLSLSLTLSLITYYFHGFLNNFLDTDKLAVPFWAFTAAIVILDIKCRNKKENDNLLTQNNIISK